MPKKYENLYPGVYVHASTGRLILEPFEDNELVEQAIPKSVLVKMLFELDYFLDYREKELKFLRPEEAKVEIEKRNNQNIPCCIKKVEFFLECNALRVHREIIYQAGCEFLCHHKGIGSTLLEERKNLKERKNLEERKDLSKITDFGFFRVNIVPWFHDEDLLEFGNIPHREEPIHCTKRRLDCEDTETAQRSKKRLKN